MRAVISLSSFLIVSFLAAQTAQAECSGSNGRGWGKGKGKGQFEMLTTDGSCSISFPGFIDDAKNIRVPATVVVLTKTPKSGQLGIATGRGLVYTPNQGFKGKDTFCTKNTSPEVKGTLSGCITVTVR